MRGKKEDWGGWPSQPGGMRVWAVSAAGEAANRCWRLYFTEPVLASAAHILFHRACLLQKHSFWVQVTSTAQGRAFSTFCKGRSWGTFRAPGNMELLWHLQDGCLGITEEMAFLAQSSALSPCSMGTETHPPQMAQWATDIFEGRWSGHRKKTSWMSLSNGSGQTGLQYNHWGITKITERDLNGDTQGSETWRCEMNSAKCGLSPLVGPRCDPQAREIWGNWRSWY